MQYILDILLFLLLIFAAKEDLKDRMVSDKYTITFLALAILFSTSGIGSKVAASLIAAVAVIFDDKIKWIGAADVIVYAGLLARFGVADSIYVVLVANIAALLCCAVKRQKSIAMMPVFMACYPILLLIL